LFITIIRFCNILYPFDKKFDASRYGFNSLGDRATTTSAVFAGYAGYSIQAFIGAENEADTQALQYIAEAVCFHSFFKWHIYAIFITQLQLLPPKNN
jgi:hypothetical protein